METTQKSPSTKYEILYEVETCLQRPLLLKKRRGYCCMVSPCETPEKYMYPLSETLGQYSSGIERNSHQYYTWHVCSSVTVLPRLAYIYPEKNNVCHMTLFVAGIILDWITNSENNSTLQWCNDCIDVAKVLSVTSSVIHETISVTALLTTMKIFYNTHLTCGIYTTYPSNNTMCLSPEAVLWTEVNLGLTVWAAHHYLVQLGVPDTPHYTLYVWFVVMTINTESPILHCIS